MTNLVCTASDTTTLATELLATVKSHLRVEFTRDDDYIKGVISRAIGEVEAVTDISIFEASWLWQLTAVSNTCISYEAESLGIEVGAVVPKTPLQSFTVTDSEGTDISDQYSLTGSSSLQYPGQARISPAPTGNNTVLNVGYTASTELPPSLLNAILAICGTLYELRESVVFGSVDLVPGWSEKIITSLWRPSA